MIKAGQKFGRLTAIKEIEERLNKGIAWECLCDCGNTITAERYRLLSGKKKSCGCLRNESPANVVDMVGKRFGKLKVIERAGATKNDNALWLCQCDCGNTTKANGTSLRRGEVVSCGCLNELQIKNARNILNTEMSIDGVQVPLLTKKVRSDSGTGHKGIRRRVKKNREYYEVSITLKGKRKYIGSFTNIDDAITARKAAEQEYFQPYIDELKSKTEKSE